MKIVHICPLYIDEYRYQDQLLPRAQAAMGHTVTVLTPIFISAVYYTMTEKDYRKTEPYVQHGVKIVRLDQRLKFLGWRLAAMKNLYKMIEKEKPDLLFAHGLSGFDILAAVKYKKKHPECCVVADSHVEIHSSARGFVSRRLLHGGPWRLIARRAEKRLDRIYYVTPWVREFIARTYGLPARKLAPTYLGGDLSALENIDRAATRERLRARWGVAQDDMLIVSAGKIDKGKGTHLLVEAIQKMNASSVHLVIVGPIEQEYKATLEKLAEGNPRVHFAGFMPSEKILEYFVASDLGVFPGNPSVLWQEAICTGLPCIFKYHPGGEYLNPGGNALFLAGNDSGELQRLLEPLVSDRGKVEAMRKAALTDGVQRFDYRNIAQEMINFAWEVRSLNGIPRPPEQATVVSTVAENLSTIRS